MGTGWQTVIPNTQNDVDFDTNVVRTKLKKIQKEREICKILIYLKFKLLYLKEFLFKLEVVM